MKSSWTPHIVEPCSIDCLINLHAQCLREVLLTLPFYKCKGRGYRDGLLGKCLLFKPKGSSVHSQPSRKCGSVKAVSLESQSLGGGGGLPWTNWLSKVAYEGALGSSERPVLVHKVEGEVSGEGILWLPRIPARVGATHTYLHRWVPHIPTCRGEHHTDLQGWAPHNLQGWAQPYKGPPPYTHMKRK